MLDIIFILYLIFVFLTHVVRKRTSDKYLPVSKPLKPVGKPYIISKIPDTGVIIVITSAPVGFINHAEVADLAGDWSRWSKSCEAVTMLLG